MTNESALKAQMTELGVKFIERTRGEAAVIRTLIERLVQGETPALEELGYLVHRIHGGGATFGFDAISACAQEIEQLIEPALRSGAPLSKQVLEQLCASGLRLEQQVAATGR